MYQAATIGKNFDTTAKYIDNPISEYYVPPYVPQMDKATAQSNYSRLLDQVVMWADKLVNANKKEVANINKIIETQQRKADQYEKAIAAMEQQNQGNGDQNQNPPILPGDTGPMPPVKLNNNTLLYAGMALLAIILLKRM